jgi:hypothetical protein
MSEALLLGVNRDGVVVSIGGGGGAKEDNSLAIPGMSSATTIHNQEMAPPLPPLATSAAATATTALFPDSNMKNFSGGAAAASFLWQQRQQELHIQHQLQQLAALAGPSLANNPFHQQPFGVGDSGIAGGAASFQAAMAFKQAQQQDAVFAARMGMMGSAGGSNSSLLAAAARCWVATLLATANAY